MGVPLARFCTRTMIAFAAAAASGLAHAHPGHGGGMLSGLLHPLLGVDHLLAIAATGIWISQLDVRAKCLLPAAFVAVMATAALAALAGVGLPVVELGILGSLVLAGLLVAFRVQMGLAAGVAVVGVFALFHGYAHGAELPALAVAWQYFAGFLLATMLLLLAGMRASRVLLRWKSALPATGALVIASGGWLAVQLV